MLGMSAGSPVTAVCRSGRTEVAAGKPMLDVRSEGLATPSVDVALAFEALSFGGPAFKQPGSKYGQAWSSHDTSAFDVVAPRIRETSCLSGLSPLSCLGEGGAAAVGDGTGFVCSRARNGTSRRNARTAVPAPRAKPIALGGSMSNFARGSIGFIGCRRERHDSAAPTQRLACTFRRSRCPRAVVAETPREERKSIDHNVANSSGTCLLAELR